MTTPSQRLQPKLLMLLAHQTGRWKLYEIERRASPKKTFHRFLSFNLHRIAWNCKTSFCWVSCKKGICWWEKFRASCGTCKLRIINTCFLPERGYFDSRISISVTSTQARCAKSSEPKSSNEKVLKKLFSPLMESLEVYKLIRAILIRRLTSKFLFDFYDCTWIVKMLLTRTSNGQVFRS